MLTCPHPSRLKPNEAAQRLKRKLLARLKRVPGSADSWNPHFFGLPDKVQYDCSERGRVERRGQTKPGRWYCCRAATHDGGDSLAWKAPARMPRLSVPRTFAAISRWAKRWCAPWTASQSTSTSESL